MAEDRADSLATHLGSMSSEELAAIARQLAELEQHPGWAVLMSLLDVQKGKLEDRLTRMLLQNAKAGRPLDERTQLISGGTLNGLEQFQAIVGRVLATNVVVQRQVQESKPGRA